MEALNQTWRKLEDGSMDLVSQEVVQIPDEIIEPELEDLVLRLMFRVAALEDALELKSEPLT